MCKEGYKVSTSKDEAKGCSEQVRGSQETKLKAREAFEFSGWGRGRPSPRQMFRGSLAKVTETSKPGWWWGFINKDQTKSKQPHDQDPWLPITSQAHHPPLWYLTTLWTFLSQGWGQEVGGPYILRSPLSPRSADCGAGSEHWSLPLSSSNSHQFIKAWPSGLLWLFWMSSLRDHYILKAVKLSNDILASSFFYLIANHPSPV